MERVIHRAWFGPLAIPERYIDYGYQWEALNPGWKTKLWTEADVQEMGLINQSAWDHISLNGAISEVPNHKPEAARATQLADVAAYEIIFNYGGVYVNCDMEPLRPLADLPVSSDDAWAPIELDLLGFGELNGKMALNNGALGGPRFHPFWKKCIERLPSRFFLTHFNLAMHYVTGPYLLTSVYYENLELLKILPKHLFSYIDSCAIPVGSDAEKFRKAAYDAGAVVLHHWGHQSKEMRE